MLKFKIEKVIMRSRLWTYVLKFLTFFLLSYNIAYSTSLPTIRIAILDNPKIVPQDNWLSQELQNAYVAGIDTAVYAAKLKGVAIDYQTFFFGNDPLAVINMIPSALKWEPDAIVGLHTSDEMLMSKNYIKNILVLSLFANDPAVSQLPSNLVV